MAYHGRVLLGSAEWPSCRPPGASRPRPETLTVAPRKTDTTSSAETPGDGRVWAGLAGGFEICQDASTYLQSQGGARRLGGVLAHAPGVQDVWGLGTQERGKLQPQMSTPLRRPQQIKHTADTQSGRPKESRLHQSTRRLRDRTRGLQVPSYLRISVPRLISLTHQSLVPL